MKNIFVVLIIVGVLTVMGCGLFEKSLKNFNCDISQDGNCIAITVQGCPE